MSWGLSKSPACKNTKLECCLRFLSGATPSMTQSYLSHAGRDFPARFSLNESHDPSEVTGMHKEVG